MKNRIITISREFGSGGRTIGKETAAKLGIPCYDQELIEKIAEESGFAKEYIAERGEYTTHGSWLASAISGRDFYGHSSQDDLWVFIHADMEQRAKRIVEQCGERTETPEKRLRDKDKRRAAYYQYYTDLKWGEARNYHIALNSGALGIGRCVEIIAHLF